jgi:hypothetical protein
MTILLRNIAIGAFLFAGVLAAHALEAPAEFTLDLPFGADQATPLWLGHPITPAGTFATLDLPITPPDATASLLVTVFYQEKSGGFLRISWNSGSPLPATDGDLPGPGEVGVSSVLCDNFYEGIGMGNQRSLLVPADTLQQGGSLHFQTGDSALGISRIKLEWLENATGLTSPAITDVLVTSADGRTQPAADLAGAPALAVDPAWKDQIVNVPITDVPVRVEQGVDFTVHLGGTPATARLVVKEAGLPWGQHLVVWLNNLRAGVIYPATPALDDPGYAAGQDVYVGWREGTFFVPVANLMAGDNVLQFSSESDTAAPATAEAPPVAPAPLALKDLNLQLDYPPGTLGTSSAPSAPTPAVPTATATTPSTP